MAPAKDIYVAYARVSKLSDGSVLTNARQFRDLDAFAAKEGVTIGERFEDRMSAWKSKKPRDAWKRMVAMVSERPNVHILTVHTDRLFRNHVDLNSLQDLAEDRGRRGKLLIMGPHQCYDLADATTQMMIRMRTEMARQEAMAASRRAIDKVNDARLRGQPGGGRYSFGFTYTPGPRSRLTGRVLWDAQVNPEQAAAAREVARRFVDQEDDGATWTALAEDLNAKGILTARGNRWTAAHLTRAMSKPKLGGLIEWTDPDGVEHLIPLAAPEGHPANEPWPILDKELYDDLQHAIRTAQRGPRNTTKTMLSNLPNCRRCRKVKLIGGSSSTPLARSTVERFGLDSDKRYLYRCPPSLGGCGLTVTACYVDDLVLSSVKEWVGRNGHTIEGHQVGDPELERAQKELEHARKLWKEGFAKAVQMGLNGPDLAEVQAQAERKVVLWTEAVAKLEDPARRREYLSTALDKKWHEDPEARRRVVEYVVTDLVISPQPRGFSGFDPGTVELTLR